MKIENLFTEVCNEFGKSLKLTTEDSPAPYFDWKKINVPTYYFKFGENFIKNVIRHEFGHLFFAPRTPLVGLTINYIGKVLDFEEPWIFTNIVTDLIVDMTNIEIFKEEYTKFLENSLASNMSKFHQFIGGVYKEKAKAIGLNTLLPENKLGKEVYEILENKEMDFYTKVYQIGQLLKSNFSTSELSLPDHSQIRLIDSTKYGPEDIARELKKHGSRSLIDQLSLENKDAASFEDFTITNDPVLINYNMDSIWASLIEFTEKSSSGYSNEKTMDLWNLGDPLNELDIPSTLTIYGSIIPGIYSIKQKNQKIHCQNDSKAKDVIIILDCSGSMMGETFEAARNAAFFLTKEIIESGGKVALIPFASTVKPKFTIPLTIDKNKILSLLTRIVPGGGTNIQPPLTMASEMDQRANIYVFTDAYIADEFQSHNTLKKIAHRTTIFLLSDYNRGEWYDVGGIRILQILKNNLIKEIKKEVKKL